MRNDTFMMSLFLDWLPVYAVLIKYSYVFDPGLQVCFKLEICVDYY